MTFAPPTRNEEALALIKRIELAGVNDRIDHLTVDVATQRLCV